MIDRESLLEKIQPIKLQQFKFQSGTENHYVPMLTRALPSACTDFYIAMQLLKPQFLEFRAKLLSASKERHRNLKFPT